MTRWLSQTPFVLSKTVLFSLIFRLFLFLFQLKLYSLQFLSSNYIPSFSKLHPKYIEIEALSDLRNTFLNVLSSIGLLYYQNIHTSFVTMRYLHAKFTKKMVLLLTTQLIILTGKPTNDPFHRKFTSGRKVGC